MMALHTYLVTAVGAAALTLTLSASGVGHAAVSAVQAVFVVNTAKNPVPVTSLGTTIIRGTVAISNTPVVTLNPAGNTVRLDPLSNTVQVGNTPANAVPVVSQDGAPAQPFQQEVTLTTTAPTASFTVPATMRLVIEYVSASGQFTCPDAYCPEIFTGAEGDVQLTTVANGASATFTLGYPAGIAFSNAPPLTYAFGGTQQVRLYADGGTSVSIATTGYPKAGGTGPFGTVSVSGYLVNTP